MYPILPGFMLALAVLLLTPAIGGPPDLAAQGPTLVAAIRMEGARSNEVGLGTAAPSLISAGFERYRTESCAGDYVCDEGGAWEIVERRQIDPDR
jgi:hypothetical protein